MSSADLESLLKNVKKFEASSSGNPASEFQIPKEIKNVKLHPYQISGVEWILSRYNQGISAILGDEMGLGKTLQSITVLTHLRFVKQQTPFLVVCPLSTMDNWASEFKKFSPKLKVVSYMDDKDARQQMRDEIVDYIKENNDKETRKKKKNLNLSFDVFLTTYEFISMDAEFISRFDWKYVVVDEAHRLKNPSSALYTTMMNELTMPHKLLLTGTPLQNNLNELWSLLHFINPELFDDADAFKDWFKDVHSTSKKNLSALHELLKPFLIRRLKADVMSDMPQKTDLILYTGLSAMQKKYYKMVLSKDYAAFAAASKTSKVSLMNVVMQLRKCCNHPYLFDNAEPCDENGEYSLGDHIINNSGKLLVLDKLLAKLKKEGHRVLIFSQMTRVLDILQDYLHYRNYTYERLDGSVRGEERFLAVKNFSADESSFVFLLSTRAGGQGLNLVAADTVIFYDLDWNPQRDLQAEARAHRIGQSKNVKVIRLITRNTFEELLFHRAYKKLILTHQVIEKGDFSTENQHVTSAELQDYIKFGLKKIFESEDAAITDEDVDALLTQGHSIEETEHLQRISKSSGKSENLTESAEKVPESLYTFQGVDYSEEAKKADDSALANFLETSPNAIATKARAAKTGDIGALEKSLRKRKVASISKEELEERKKQKRDERIQLKRQKTGYVSKVLSPSKILSQDSLSSDSDEDKQGKEEVLNEEAEPEIDINYVMGDVMQPQGPTDQNAIVVNCVDNSGEWGRGGLFTAISQSSQDPVKEYELAGEMEDLELGSVQIVPVKAIEESDKKIYVANMVVQKRTKGKISGILISALKNAFEILAKEALRMNATVHTPRIGAKTPNFNWYSIERTIRGTLIRANIPTYIYYYPRKQATPAKVRKVNSDEFGSPSARDEGMESANSAFSPKKALPEIFTNCNILLSSFSDKKKEKELERKIIAFGGNVEKNFNPKTTHIVMPLDKPVMKVLASRAAQINCKIVSLLWLEDSLDQMKVAKEEPYALST